MDGPAPRLSLIAAMDRRQVIGVDGDRMPWHLPEDLRHFRRTTLGRPVIMGRRTWDSIGRPLPGRLNIVLSRSGRVEPVPGRVVIAAGLPEALQLARNWLASPAPAPAEGDLPAPGPGAPEIFVIGGAEVYALALAQADRLLLTEIDAEFEGRNRFPPFRDGPVKWVETARETHRAAPPNDFGFAFVTYERGGAAPQPA